LRSWRCLLAMALVVALACGKNAEEERLDEARAICEALVGQTVADAKPQLGQIDALPSQYSLPRACFADLAAWNDRDTCPYDGTTEICTRGGWNFWTTDPDLCDGAGCVMQPDGFCRPVRCWYGCVIRYRLDALVPSEDPTIGLTICASRWVSRQQNPPAG
jgi:hypothetical protein